MNKINSANKRLTLVDKLRLVVQIFCLIVFIFLISINQNKIWMNIMLGSFMITFIFGRFYCGWICPINTLMRLVDWLAKKLKIQHNDIPPVLKSPWLRYVIFILFLVSMILLKDIIKLNMLLIIMPFALLVTVFLPSAAWHRYLCPFGILFSIPARLSLFNFGINNDNCASCGRCRKICPGVAVEEERTKGKRFFVLPRHCLLCFECTKFCPQKAISVCKR